MMAALSLRPVVYRFSTTPRAIVSCRSIKTLDFGGTKETVYERSDYPKEKINQLFANDQLGVIGYGTQGRAQSQNLRDNGLPVIVGVRKDGVSWALAQQDGWVPGKTLFSIEEACDRSTVVMNLLSDAGQKNTWSIVRKYLTPKKTLYFSHGFSLVFSNETHVVPPKNIDIILVAPKGSGTTLRSLFLEGRGINSSVGVLQDVSGMAKNRALALAVSIGSGYMFDTTFKKEVYGDLTGERGVLMGAIQGLFQAQYEVLREKGHTPSEAFNETVEEATQSLYPLIGANGMDWMYANCSTTAQRGALDWWPSFYQATKPIIKRLYESVKAGEEARRVLEKCGQSNYRQELEKELDGLRNSEMWRAGKTIRLLRPEAINKQ